MARDLSCPRTRDRPEVRKVSSYGKVMGPGGPGRTCGPADTVGPGEQAQRLRARSRSTPDGESAGAAGEIGPPRGTPHRETEVPEVPPKRNVDSTLESSRPGS